MADKDKDPFALLLNRKGKKLPQGALGPLNGPLGWLLLLGVMVAGFLPNFQRATGLSTPRPTPPTPGQPRQLVLPGFEPPPAPKRSSGGWCLLVGLGCVLLLCMCMAFCVLPVLKVVLFG
jgi:hypothetical protein